jgi:predicted ribonuclease YlaK
MDGHVTIKVGDYTAKVSLNARTYKHVQQGKGQKSKDSTIVRVAAKLERAEQTMFAVSHKARIEERIEARRNERLAYREAKREAKRK